MNENEYSASAARKTFPVALSGRSEKSDSGKSSRKSQGKLKYIEQSAKAS